MFACKVSKVRWRWVLLDGCLGTVYVGEVECGVAVTILKAKARQSLLVFAPHIEELSTPEEKPECGLVGTSTSIYIYPETTPSTG